MKKILKNNSGQLLTLLGVQVEDQSQYDVPSHKWLELRGQLTNQEEIYTRINNGEIIVNDGNNDLSISQGLIHLEQFQDPPLLENLDFDHVGWDSDNAKDAIVEASEKGGVRSVHTIQYQTIDTMGYSEYLYSGHHSRNNFNRRSGDRSNGYAYSNCAPPLCPVNGKVTKATFVIKGIAQSTGSPASTVTVNFELWNVGFNGGGTKIADIDIDVDSSEYTIGNWWNSSIDTNFKGSISLNIDVNEGDLLGLKFIRVQNNSNAVSIKNPTVILRIEEND